MLTANFEKQFEYRGKLEGSQETLVDLRIVYDKYKSDPPSCEVVPLDNRKGGALRIFDSLFNESGDPLQIKLIDSQETIRLWGLHGTLHGNEKVSANLSRFELGNIGTVKSPCTVHGAVALTGGDILSQPRHEERTYQGEIKNKPKRLKAIKWKFENWEVEALQAANWEDENISDQLANLRILRPTLYFVRRFQEKITLEDVANEIEQKVLYVCHVLSLCYRRIVWWYQIKIDVLFDDRASWTKAGFIRSYHSQLNYPERTDSLIEYDGLINGGLRSLLKTFQKDPDRKKLEEIIVFLGGSNSLYPIEIQYFLCLSAMDALFELAFGRMTNKTSIEKKAWTKRSVPMENRLNKILRKDDTKEIVKIVKELFPEIARVPLKDKILVVCEKLRVSVDDLWNPLTFEYGLARAMNLRNSLFHGASAKANTLLFPHLVRVRTLCERTLIKILDFPEDRLWLHRDQILRRVNNP